jgi:hypothetical protein
MFSLICGLSGGNRHESTRGTISDVELEKGRSIGAILGVSTVIYMPKCYDETQYFVQYYKPIKSVFSMQIAPDGTPTIFYAL